MIKISWIAMVKGLVEDIAIANVAVCYYIYEFVADYFIIYGR